MQEIITVDSICRYRDSSDDLWAYDCRTFLDSVHLSSRRTASRC